MDGKSFILGSMGEEDTIRNTEVMLGDSTALYKAGLASDLHWEELWAQEHFWNACNPMRTVWETNRGNWKLWSFPRAMRSLIQVILDGISPVNRVLGWRVISCSGGIGSVVKVEILHYTGTTAGKRKYTISASKIWLHRESIEQFTSAGRQEKLKPNLR